MSFIFYICMTIKSEIMTEKIIIYQLLPRLFGNNNLRRKYNGNIEENGSGKFKNISELVLSEIKKSGYTHIWYIGIIAHASTTNYLEFGIPKEYPEIIKGKAGSPYAIRDYYDVDPDLAENIDNRMKEFEQLIERTHKAGLKVFIDFVPNHLARNYRSINKPKNIKDLGENDDTNHAFSPQNNFYYLPNKQLSIQFVDNKIINYIENPAKVTGNDCFTETPSQFDWYETVKLNYGIDYINGRKKHFSPIPNTWIKMRDILMFWASKNIDGFRCDMAEMVPIEFWRWAVQQVKDQHKNIIFFGETYNPSEYRSFLDYNTFNYLYDKVGLYDVLRDVSCGKKPASDITFALNNVGDIQNRMVNFIENHDEQRVASDYFLSNGKNAIASFILIACINSNPIMVYAGQEFGERGMDVEGFSGKDGRTSIYDYWSIDTISRWNNNGKWDGKMLTEEERNLQQFYAKLLIICNETEALREGLFYDLMPINYDNEEFDSTKKFAFLRGNKNGIVLVVVNYDNCISSVKVRICENAFRFFNIQYSTKGIASPFLFSSEKSYSFSDNEPLKVTLGAYSGEVYKISFL